MTMQIRIGDTFDPRVVALLDHHVTAARAQTAPGEFRRPLVRHDAKHAIADLALPENEGSPVRLPTSDRVKSPP